MNSVVRFARKYKQHLLHLTVEEMLGALARGLPSLPGMWVRAVVWKAMFKRMAGFPLIYPGVYFTHSYGISAGRGFSTNTGVLIDGRGGITIGDNVLIGPYTVLASSTHDHRNTKDPITTPDHLLLPTNIGDDVWIGAHCFIHGGVRIGSGCVIGAGSVVLDDVPDYTIAAGAPARQVGTRVRPTSLAPATLSTEHLQV